MPRQRECLRLVFEHHSTKEIAQRLGLAPGTVDQYIAGAVRTLGATNRREAARLLATHEAADPSVFEYQSAGLDVAPDAPAVEVPPDEAPDWRAWLPLRPKGARRNELNPMVRLAWAVALMLLMLIAFGMLVTGLKVAGDLYDAFRRP